MPLAFIVTFFKVLPYPPRQVNKPPAAFVAISALPPLRIFIVTLSMVAPIME